MYQRKRRGGRFFGRRVNCEQVPLLPAWAVAWVLDDPRKIPYLLVWKNPRSGIVEEAVRISRHDERPYLDGIVWNDAVEIKRTDGTSTIICAVPRPLPRNGGNTRLLFCPYCQIPRRALYAWEVDHWGRYTTSARTAAWKCRACASLRYTSEGGALVLRSRWSFFRMIEQRYGGFRSPRPEPWYPYVFTSINDPRLDEVLGYSPAGRRSVG